MDGDFFRSLQTHLLHRKKTYILYHLDSCTLHWLHSIFLQDDCTLLDPGNREKLSNILAFGFFAFPVLGLFYLLDIQDPGFPEVSTILILFIFAFERWWRLKKNGCYFSSLIGPSNYWTDCLLSFITTVLVNIKEHAETSLRYMRKTHKNLTLITSASEINISDSSIHIGMTSTYRGSLII